MNHFKLFFSGLMLAGLTAVSSKADNLWVVPIALDNDGEYNILLKFDSTTNKFGLFQASNQFKHLVSYQYMRTLTQGATQTQTNGLWRRNQVGNFLSLNSSAFYNLLGINAIETSLETSSQDVGNSNWYYYLRLKYQGIPETNKNLLWMKVEDIETVISHYNAGKIPNKLDSTFLSQFEREWKSAKPIFDRMYRAETFQEFTKTEEYKKSLGDTWYELANTQPIYENFLDLNIIIAKDGKNIWNYHSDKRMGSFSLKQAIENYEKYMKPQLTKIFNENPHLQQALVATGDKILLSMCTHPTFDNYYLCIGPDANGENMIGQLLMQLRDKYNSLPIGNYSLGRLLEKQRKNQNSFVNSVYRALGLFKRLVSRD